VSYHGHALRDEIPAAVRVGLIARTARSDRTGRIPRARQEAFPLAGRLGTRHGRYGLGGWEQLRAALLLVKKTPWRWAEQRKLAESTALPLASVFREARIREARPAKRRGRGAQRRAE